MLSRVVVGDPGKEEVVVDSMPDVSSGFALAPILIVAFVVVVAAMIVWAVVSAGRRREEMQAAASAQGWAYTEEDPSLARRWDAEPFVRGASGRALDVLRGRRGDRQFVAFTYRYTTTEMRMGTGTMGSTGQMGMGSTVQVGSTGPTTQSEDHHVAVVAVTDLPARGPQVCMTPASLARRVAQALFSSSAAMPAEFTRLWRLQADPAVAARLAGGPFLIWALSPQAAGRSYRLEGAEALTWVTGRLDPAAVPDALGHLEAFLAALPAELWTARPDSPGR